MAGRQPHSVTRRAFLAMSAAATAAACDTGRPRRDAAERISYGDAPRQHIELHRPAGADAVPVVVLVHGGFWSNQYRLDLMGPLRDDLASAGTHAIANVEYRSLGDDGGGWPGTLHDAAAAVDLLADVQPSLDLASVTVVGHSAGGQLAAWLAARPALADDAPGSRPVVVPTRVVSLAGVLDLVTGARSGLGAGACEELLGGSPDEVPDRYAIASPVALLPFRSEIISVHGDGDRHVPRSQSEAFVAAANAAGTTADLQTGAGDHFDVIDPQHELWRGVRGRILA
jgi:acetyl esterase/lipase